MVNDITIQIAIENLRTTVGDLEEATAVIATMTDEVKVIVDYMEEMHRECIKLRERLTLLEIRE